MALDFLRRPIAPRKTLGLLKLLCNPNESNEERLDRPVELLTVQISSRQWFTLALGLRAKI
jgi:hypothetical protein